MSGEQNLCEEKIAFAYELDGGFADYMLIKHPAYVNGLILKHDSTLTHEAATLVEPLSCVLHGQRRINPTTNENTVIIGAGPIGAMHMLLSKKAGARTIVSEKFPDRLDLMRHLGADELINSQEEDPVKRVREITGNRGAEVVIVCASSLVCQQQALRMASKKGRVLFFAGLPPSVTEVPLETNLIHYRDLTILGSFEASFKDFEDALRIVTSGKPNMKALITHRIPLDGILEAIHLVETGKAIKVVVTTRNANAY
jgi:L-iditol 2-dehydrogenase